MSSNLAFNVFSRGLLEGGAWALRTVLKIFCRFFSIYLAIEGSIARGLIEVSSWLDSKESKDSDGSSEVCFLRGRPQPRIDVIFVVGIKRSRVNPKQRYVNGLAYLLGVEQLE